MNENTQPVLTRFNEIEAKLVDWLWPGKIPLGMLSLIVGNQETGKSTLSLYMATKVSRGGYWPDDPDVKVKAGSVIILTTEDDLSRTVKPRLEAAGADMSKVITISAIRENSDVEGEESTQRELYNLTTDCGILLKAIGSIGDVRLVIIDPISSYIEGKNPNSNIEVREFLIPLVKLAERTKVAIVGINHLNKDSQKQAAYRILGSIAWTATPRAVWLVAKDAEDEDKRLLLPIKCNLAKERTGLAFRLDEVEVKVDHETAFYPKCRFEPGAIYQTADEILDVEARRKKKKRIEEAIEWLEDTLSDGPKFINELEKMAVSAGIYKKTLERAKKKRGIESIANRDSKGRICAVKWALPAHKS